MPRFTYTFDLRDSRGFGITLDVAADTSKEARQKLRALSDLEDISLGDGVTACLWFNPAMKDAEMVTIYDQNTNTHLK